MDIFEFIQRFTRANLFGGATIIEIDGKYFLANERQAELAQQMQIRPIYLGVYLGKAGEKFKPSFFLLEMLKAHAKRITVSDKAAWLFLCGRDILKESIIRKDKIEPHDDVLVLDQRGSVLGYGYYMNERIRNVLDRGDFLRREREQEKEQPERLSRARPARSSRPSSDRTGFSRPRGRDLDGFSKKSDRFRRQR